MRELACPQGPCSEGWWEQALKPSQTSLPRGAHPHGQECRGLQQCVGASMASQGPAVIPFSDWNLRSVSCLCHQVGAVLKA